MPLKDADLKTFEAYKKAIRQDLPKITSGNAKFWIYRDVELPDASGKKQKIASFIVLVDQNAVKNSLKGKKLICKGTCGMQDGKVDFDAESGQVPYKLLKKNVPFLLGKMVHVPSNANEDAEGGEAAESETEETAKSNGVQQQTVPPPPPPPPTGAGLAATWNKLLKDVQTAVAANPARKEALSQAAAGIPDLIRGNKTEEAKQKMERLQGMLNAPPPPPSQPPGAALATEWNKLVKDVQAAAAANPARKAELSQAAAGIPDLIKENKAYAAQQKMAALRSLLGSGAGAPASGSAPSTAELSARWNALVKQLQAEVAAHPEKKADLTRAAAGIPDMIKAGKLDLAKKLMDGVDEVLKQVGKPLGTAPPPTERTGAAGEKEEEEESAEPAAKAEYEHRFAALDERVQSVLGEGLGDASQIRSVSGFASEKADVGDYTAALKALDRLEALLDKAPEEGRADAGVFYEGLVKYRGALLQFAQAKDKITKQIAALKTAIPATLPDEAEIAEELAWELTDWNDELAELINDAMNTAEDEESPLTNEIKTRIQQYIADVGTDELILHVDKSPFVPMSVGKTLSEALLRVQQAMPVKRASA